MCWLIAAAITVGCSTPGKDQPGAGAGGNGGGAGAAGARAATGNAGGTGGEAAGAGGQDVTGAAGAEAGAAGTVAGAGGTDIGGMAGSAGIGGCRTAAGVGGAAGAASVVVYSNDFETPNIPLAVNCGNALDDRGINALYGTPTFGFTQLFTVEGVVIHDPAGKYADPEGTGKNYAVGMLSTNQDDHLALTFAVTGQPFLNVGFDLSSIDVVDCGGPFGVAVPKMRVSLYDTPTGAFNFGAPGSLLSQEMVTGVAAPSPWTFAWTYGVVTLDATGVTRDAVTVVFDLLESGYAAIDNLSIVASGAAGVVDRNNNGIPDDQEGCP